MVGKQIKGRMVISGRKFIRDRAAGRDLDKAIAGLGAEAREMMTTRLSPSAWYSTAAADEVLRACAEALGEDPRSFARDLGWTAAYDTAGAIGRTFVSLFGSPARMAKYIGTAREQIYDSGTTTATYDEAGGRVQIEVRGWLGHTEHGCLNMLGLLDRYANLMRASASVEVAQTRCLSRGNDACVFELRFR